MYRNPLLDNVKFIMIFFVVLGHFIEPFYKTNDLLRTVWMFIYTFHMPVFVFVSGMVVKTAVSDQKFRKDLISILIPFIAFTFMYELYNYQVTGEISNYSKKLQPYWILWFLPSLFIWKVSIGYMAKFRFPIILSIAISLGAGYFNSIGYFLGISRTIYFFPFFIMGYYSSSKSLFFLDKLKKVNFVIYLSILIIVLGLVVYFKNESHQWLLGSFSYKRLSSSGIEAAIIRLTLYLVSISCIISILGLTPTVKTVFSNWGQNSLYVYVWHGFIIKILINVGFISALGNTNTVVIVICMSIIAVLTTCLLSLGFVRNVTDRFILKPISKALLKSD